MSNTFFPIKHRGKTVAVVIRASHRIDNLQFFTEEANPLQVGIHHKPPGVNVQPHVHTTQPRTISEVHEVFFIVRGKIRLTMYSHRTGEKIRSVILRSGDSVVHMGEGHGLDFLEETVLFEVKQGPYFGVETSKLYLNPTIISS